MGQTVIVGPESVSRQEENAAAGRFVLRSLAVAVGGRL